MRVSVDLEFSAAHRLPAMPEGHPCRRPHGHNYRVRIVVGGEVSQATGLVCDFQIIEDTFTKYLADRLDHRDLNDLLTNPTAENIAQWIWTEMQRRILRLEAVTVWETERYSATICLGDES